MLNYLLIEKDLEKFKYLLNTISEFDYNLRLEYIAITGKESLNVIKSYEIDFILLDSNITDINFLEILEFIEKEKKYKNSVIVISDNELEFTQIEKFTCVNSIIKNIHNKRILKSTIFNMISSKRHK